MKTAIPQTSSTQRGFDDVWVQLLLTNINGELMIRSVIQRRGGFAFELFRNEQTRMPLPEELHEMQRSYAYWLHLYQQDVADDVPLAAPPATDELRALGRRITSLLPLAVQREIALAVFHAQRRKRGLRLTFEIAPELKDLFVLPWEMLTLPLTRSVSTADDLYTMLLRAANVTLVRQVRGVGYHVAPVLATPLAVQIFAAAPRGARPIDLAATRMALGRVFGDGIDSFWHDGNNTLEQMRQRIRSNAPQIVHMLCHGQRTATLRGSRSDLLLQRSDGGIVRTSAFDLWPIFSLSPDLQLVILQACTAGEDMVTLDTSPEERQAIESIALALIRQGVPMVIAMQGRVLEKTAAAFIETFYRELVANQSIEDALGRARTAMMTPEGGIDWTLPVVYQGSGRPEPRTWHRRVALSIEAALYDPVVVRTLRGAIAATAIGLFVVAIFRWLLFPGSPIDTTILVLPLAVWVSAGVVGPGLVAFLTGISLRFAGIPTRERRAIRLAQWVGAYTAFALTGLFGLAGLVILWTIGIVALLPVGSGVFLLAGITIIALVLSYVGAQSQARTAEALAPLAPGLFANTTLMLILTAMIGLIAAPLGVIQLGETPLSFLLAPAPAALALSLALTSLIFMLRR